MNHRERWHFKRGFHIGLSIGVGLAIISILVMI